MAIDETRYLREISKQLARIGNILERMERIALADSQDRRFLQRNPLQFNPVSIELPNLDIPCDVDGDDALIYRPMNKEEKVDGKEG